MTTRKIFIWLERIYLSIWIFSVLFITLNYYFKFIYYYRVESFSYFLLFSAVILLPLFIIWNIWLFISEIRSRVKGLIPRIDYKSLLKVIIFSIGFFFAFVFSLTIFA